MSIKELQEVYAKHPNVAGLASLRKNKDIKTVYLEGMHGSCASLFASVSVKTMPGIHVFILNDLEEAGYFYHDLVQVDGEADVLFFPSSYRRAIKYGQKDAANEILRTEVLSRLEQKKPVTVVTYPEALAEKVVSRKRLSDAMLTLKVGQQEDTVKLMETLSKYGFEHVTMSMSRDSLPCAAAFLTCILLHRNILTELTFSEMRLTVCVRLK